MKTLLNLIVFLSFISVVPQLKAQEVQHAFKWEASTITGGIYIGISTTRREALLEIQNLMEIKKGNEGVVDFEIRFSPIQTASNKSIFDEFKTLNLSTNSYVFLTKEDLKAIKINRQWGRYNCEEYYSNAIKFKKKKMMTAKLDNILAFEKFLFLTQNDQSKEIYANTTNQKL